MNSLADLRHWIPGSQLWYGPYTGSWWAYLPGRPGRLIEAATPDELLRRLAPLAASIQSTRAQSVSVRTRWPMNRSPTVSAPSHSRRVT